MSGKRLFIIVAILLVVVAVIVRVTTVSRGVGNITESSHGVVDVPAPVPPPLTVQPDRFPVSKPPLTRTGLALAPALAATIAAAKTIPRTFICLTFLS